MSTMKERMEQIRKNLQPQSKKLSDAEKAQLTEAFDNVKALIDATREDVLKMDRDDAFAYFETLTKKLEEVDQGTPPEQIAKGENITEFPTSPTPPPSTPAPPSKKLYRVDGQVREGVSLDLPVAPAQREGAKGPIRVVTEKEFQSWFDSLPANLKGFARKLDCVKNFLDEKSPDKTGPICAECSAAALIQCARNEDPNFHDADTDFVKFQLEGGGRNE
jgi:hypothetical protein